MMNEYRLGRHNIYREKKHIVVDCDEVLTRISPKWVNLMHLPENYDYFNKYFRLDPSFNLGKDFDRVLERPVFNLDRWLLRKNVLDDYGIEEYNEARRNLLNLYMGDYYRDLPPTDFGRSLSMVATGKLADKISVVTRVDESKPDLTQSKVDFLQQLFNGANHLVDIYLIEKDEKKSDLISDLGNEIGYIYEDELSNVEDIIENCSNLENMSIMIPSYGYNRDLEQYYYNQAAEREINIRYYFDRPDPKTL